MSDKEMYMAFVLNRSEYGNQLLRYAFEHPIVEYYGEPEEQANLVEYFKANHYTHATPIIVERADIIDYMAYKKPGAQS